MKQVTKSLPIALLALALAHGAASATPQADLAFEIQESNGDKASGWMIEKLVTFKLGDKCWAKVVEKKMVDWLAGIPRDIEKYAQGVTGEEFVWSAFENRGPSDNREIVKTKIDEFKPKFHLTISNEGADCEGSGSAPWFKYTSALVQALVLHPPKSGKAFLFVNATAKAKTVTVKVSKDGSTFTLTGPRDTEPSGWGDGRIEKAFKRVSSKN